jgi:MraZ protein
MFLGEYQHTLDPKGRVILPSAFREQLQEGLVLAFGHDNCINVHPTAHWQQEMEGLRALRTTDARQRRFARMKTSSAHPQELDKQGRITIPSRLRDYAGLTKDVTVVGQDSIVELWDSERWEAYLSEGMTAFAGTDEAFGEGPF